MSKLRDEFCASIKKTHAPISAKTDAEYARHWGGHVDTEYYSYSWFEALARALNKEMNQMVPAALHSDLFLAISARFKSGDECIREAIEVAFVENLFWQVSRDKSVSYWEVLPDNLKRLYVDFHGRAPIQ